MFSGETLSIVFGTFKGEQSTSPSIYAVPFQTTPNGTVAFNLTKIHQITFSTSMSVFSTQGDVARNRLYFCDGRSASIYAIDNYMFTNVSTRLVHRGTSRGYVRIAVDWISNNIYWTEPDFKAVMIQSMNNPKGILSVVNTDLGEPLGIAVDPKNGYLFTTFFRTFR